jgi:hypothetical protein
MNLILPFQSDNLEEYHLPLFNVVLDLELIYGEYSQYHDFWFDYKNIPYNEMYMKIVGLPNFRDIIQLRQRYLKGEKLSQEERKHVKKLLNSEIEFYLNDKKTIKTKGYEEIAKSNILAELRKVQESNKMHP